MLNCQKPGPKRGERYPSGGYGYNRFYQSKSSVFVQREGHRKIQGRCCGGICDEKMPWGQNNNLQEEGSRDPLPIIHQISNHHRRVGQCRSPKISEQNSVFTQ